LPERWYHLLQDLVARARPQSAGHGWDPTLYLLPTLRRVLDDAHADPAAELAMIQHLVRPGMRFLN